MTEPIAHRRALIGLPGERKSVPGLPFVIRARAEETGGAFEVYEVGVPGERAGLGAGPPPHVHREHEETFYVLEGEFEFFLGDDPTAAPTGTLIVVPRGTRHNFRGTPGPASSSSRPRAGWRASSRSSGPDTLTVARTRTSGQPLPGSTTSTPSGREARSPRGRSPGSASAGTRAR